MREPVLRTARDAVDHLLVGARDLDEGIAWLEARTGVRAVAGGSHPGWGTRNALVSLGPGQYLEIIAPDPAQATYAFGIDVRALDEPQLVTWAASTADAASLVAQADREGIEMSPPRAGSRTRPDGSQLGWKTAWVASSGPRAVVEPIPFFIEWDRESAHPSSGAPRGCHLLGFDLRHPQPDLVTGRLAALGIEVVVAEASAPGLVAVLDTPSGRVTI
jgi:hypothetical protein